MNEIVVSDKLALAEDQHPVIAICYDFDKTLSPKDMQEYTLFPKLGWPAQKFWTRSNNDAKTHGMDKIASYMRLILKIAEEQDSDLALTKEAFMDLGKGVELFDGLDTWFSRINEYAAEKGFNTEHYIISAGLKEIIEGTAIGHNFKAIYASTFFYNKFGVPQWPSQVVNFTQKTQYLFRINKNCLDLADEDSVNKVVAKADRRIPFERFIYIGDSDTDIPAMRVVKMEKGFSIGVYNPKNEDGAEKICRLIADDRINFFAPADYRQDRPMETYVKKAIDQIRANYEVAQVTKAQAELAGLMSYVRGFEEFLLDRSNVLTDLTVSKRNVDSFFKDVFTDVKEMYSGECFVPNDVISSLKKIKNDLLVRLREKAK